MADNTVWHEGKEYDGKGGVWKPSPPDAKYEAQPKEDRASEVLVASTGVVYVAATGVDCTTNNCTNYPPQNRGCAVCALIRVQIPKTGQIVSVDFGCTAGGPPGDYPYPVAMPPGEGAWCHYDGWGRDDSGAYTVIYGSFHNRSSNRARGIVLTVRYTMP